MVIGLRNQWSKINSHSREILKYQHYYLVLAAAIRAFNCRRTIRTHVGILRTHNIFSIFVLQIFLVVIEKSVEEKRLQLVRFSCQFYPIHYYSTKN